MRTDFYAQVAQREAASGTRVGGLTLPRDEPVRFVPSVSLAFAPADAHDTASRELVTTFLGLAGGSGALPPFMREELENEDERPVRRALLTPFHHRAVSLLHRSVYRCRVPDATQAIGDVWPTRLADLVAGEVEDDETRALALLVAPLLFGRPSARSLSRALPIVARAFLEGAPIALRERNGRRLPVADVSRSRLGIGGTTARLGDSAMLGGTIDDPGHHASIVVGPIDAAGARMLAPDGAAHRALARVVAWLAGADVTVDLEIVHAPDARASLGAGTLGRASLGRGGRSRSERVELFDETRARSCR